MGPEEQGATADAGFDMAAAVDEIGAGLGFERESDAEGSETTAAEGEASAAAPATTQAAQAAATPQGEQKPAGLTPDNPGGLPRAPSPDTPPSTWREGPKAKWAALDPEVRAEIVKREDDFFKGIEGYKVDAHTGKQLNQVLEPFKETLQRYGVEPLTEIRNLLAAHHALATGTPAMQLQMFRSLMQEYKINPQHLAMEPEYTDPKVESLQQRLDRIESGQAQERAVQLRREIDTFAADPANTHFKDLANDIAQLLRGGVVQTLREAYDKALWLNPVVRQKELDRQQAERAAEEEATRKKQLDAAKKAKAANFRSGSPARSDTTAAGSMDDTLSSTLRGIRERNS